MHDLIPSHDSMLDDIYFRDQEREEIDKDEKADQSDVLEEWEEN